MKIYVLRRNLLTKGLNYSKYSKVLSMNEEELAHELNKQLDECIKDDFIAIYTIEEFEDLINLETNESENGFMPKNYYIRIFN